MKLFSDHAYYVKILHQLTPIITPFISLISPILVLYFGQIVFQLHQITWLIINCIAPLMTCLIITPITCPIKLIKN